MTAIDDFFRYVEISYKVSLASTAREDMQDADLSALANTTFGTSGAILYPICSGYLDPLPVLTPLVGINTKSVFFFTLFSSSFLYTSPKTIQPLEDVIRCKQPQSSHCD